MTDERRLCKCGHTEGDHSEGQEMDLDGRPTSPPYPYCYECQVDDRDDSAHPFEAAPSTDEGEAREQRGRRVREIWMAWAREQSVPKASWLVPWEELTEPEREVDRRIGSALWGDGFADGLNAGYSGEAAIRAPLEERIEQLEQLQQPWVDNATMGIAWRARAEAAEERIRELEAHNKILAQADGQVADRATSLRAENERLREALRVANKALHENITTWITLSPVLEEPYPDDPRWTPWTRFGKRAADAAVNAQSEIKRALATPPSSTEGTKEVEE